MLRAPLDDFSHVVVEDGDLEHVTLQHLEGQEEPDLDLVANGESRPPLVKADLAADLLELHHPAAASVGFEHDRPRDSAR